LPLTFNGQYSFDALQARTMGHNSDFSVDKKAEASNTDAKSRKNRYILPPFSLDLVR